MLSQNAMLIKTIDLSAEAEEERLLQNELYDAELRISSGILFHNLAPLYITETFLKKFCPGPWNKEPS